MGLYYLFGDMPFGTCYRARLIEVIRQEGNTGKDSITIIMIIEYIGKRSMKEMVFRFNCDWVYDFLE
jgi:hypothetical protein